MLLPLLAQTALVLPLPGAQGPARLDLRQTGCEAPEITRRLEGESDFDNDGNVDFAYHRTHRHDARGNEILYTEEGPHYAERIERTFDSAGREIRSVTTGDEGNDGSLDSQESQEQTYDADGRLLTQRFETITNDFESVTDVTYVWAPDGSAVQGSAVQGTALVDLGRDGSVDQILVLDATFDAQGNPLGQTVTTDSDADGSVDATHQSTYTYDAHGNRLTALETEDDDNDGMNDYVFSETQTYDALGQLTSVVVLWDNDGDGSFDQRNEDTLAYDANGNQVSRFYVEDSDNDGAPERTIQRTTTYDPSGNPILVDQGNDNDGDGNVDTREMVASTYDVQGRLALETLENYAVANPLGGTAKVRTFTWSAAGTLLHMLEETDEGRDGSVDSVRIERRLVEDLRVNATRGLQERVLAMDLGGSEATLAALLASAVTALEQGNVSLALRHVIAFDATTSNLEGAGSITPEASVELRTPAAAILELFLTTCFAFEE